MKQLLIITALICSLSTVNAQPSYKLEGGKLLLSHSIDFKPGTAELIPSSDTGLNEIKQFLTDKKYITLLRIESHVAKGSMAGNMDDLTKARSLSIAGWLVKNGVDCKRLLPVAFGSSKPIVADNGDANTRIELIPAALNNRPIGGMPVDGGGMATGEVCNK